MYMYNKTTQGTSAGGENDERRNRGKKVSRLLVHSVYLHTASEKKRSIFTSLELSTPQRAVFSDTTIYTERDEKTPHSSYRSLCH